MLTFAIGMSAVSATALIVAGATGLGGLAGVLAPMMLVLAAAGLAMPNTPALALTRHGEAAGTASALLGFSQFGVGAVVAPLVGLFGGTSAVPMGAMMLLVTLAAGVLMLGIVRRDPSVHAMD